MKKLISILCIISMLIMMMLPLSIYANEPLKTNKITYTEGEDILITATGEEKDWVGIYKKGETIGNPGGGGVSSIRWYYVAKDGNVSGHTKNIFDSEYVERKDLANLLAGEYTVYLLKNDGYEILAQVDITITANEDSTTPSAPASVRYDLTQLFPGAADGKLTITAGEGELPESYRAYWANQDGALKDYTAFAPITCKGKTTAYEMVANTLIPADADRVLVYAVRGNNTSESAATVMLPEGCNNYDFGTPLYEMQVMSDIHINRSQTHIHNQHFAMALADIKKLSPNSIGIFVNGDIADHGEEAEYRSFQQLIKNAGAGLPKVYCSIGNHDLANGPYDDKLNLFLKYTDPATDSVYFDQWIDGVHFIYLGSEATGLNAQLSRKQLNWFKKALAENRDENRPIYVFLHQGLIDTVAGTFAYQKWHGINQAKEFAKILKDYSEVILFSGHSHWEMDSLHSMKARDENLPTVFNTSSVAYLWNDASMSTNAGIEGSQGYYLYAYEDKVLVLGRDFANGKWIASAQYVVDYPQDKSEEGGGTDENEAVTTPPTTNQPQTAEPANVHIGAVVCIVAAVIASAGAVVTAIRMKNRKK